MEHDKRVCIYPCYLNQNYSVSQGRRIPKSSACDNPTAPEIYDCVVQGLKLPADVERKRHPKDWKYLGRIRVQIKDDKGEVINNDVPSKQALMLKIAQLVPRHPGRTGKAKAQTQAGAGAGPAGSSSSSSSSAPIKKSGKKKR